MCVCVRVSVSRGIYLKVCSCTSLLVCVRVPLCDVILRLCLCACVPCLHNSFFSFCVCVCLPARGFVMSLCVGVFLCAWSELV